MLPFFPLTGAEFGSAMLAAFRELVQFKPATVWSDSDELFSKLVFAELRSGLWNSDFGRFLFAVPKFSFFELRARFPEISVLWEEQLVSLLAFFCKTQLAFSFTEYLK